MSNNSEEPIKSKRGRKSKKELMAALNMEAIVKEAPKKMVKSASSSTLNDSTLNESALTENDILIDTNIPDSTKIYINISPLKPEHSDILDDNVSEEPKQGKKRGRKPKGGKIIQLSTPNILQVEDKPNVILHLKCSTKDLQCSKQTNFIESYNFSAAGNKNDLTYEILEEPKKQVTMCDSDDEFDDDSVSICKDTTKEIWKKLKQLETNLHVNNVNNKRSCCFWDTCEFDNPPIYIPKYYLNGTYHVYGCFCSPECGVAYLMEENIDSSTKFERYHLFNYIYTKIYGYTKNVKPAPNPYYMLSKYYGNLSVPEYRSLLKNERLFLIVDKPLTRILPELHEDNDDFILNNKIIPSNNSYQVKSRLQKKKPNKNVILNEKFGSAQLE
jgi:hypothetical protein